LNGSSHQEAFDKIKKVIVTEVILCYPDCDKPIHFHLYTDASDHQLGAVIMKTKKPISFYSRKCNTAQKRYTTTERDRELLSVIKTYKEYKNILLGHHVSIIVFTDHKNNTFNGFKDSDRAFRWLLLLEEYGVTFEYLPGKKNIVADVFIRESAIHLKSGIQSVRESCFQLSKPARNTRLSC
jgi:hypothetical protein